MLVRGGPRRSPLRNIPRTIPSTRGGDVMPLHLSKSTYIPSQFHNKSNISGLVKTLLPSMRYLRSTQRRTQDATSSSTKSSGINRPGRNCMGRTVLAVARYVVFIFPIHSYKVLNTSLTVLRISRTTSAPSTSSSLAITSRNSHQSLKVLFG